MDLLAGAKRPLPARPAHLRLGARLQNHFNSTLCAVEIRDVAPLPKIKIGADDSIDVIQQVAIERRRHAQRIVVRRFQRGAILDQIDTEQQAAIVIAGRANSPQQRRGFAGREVAERGAGIKKQALRTPHHGRQFEVRRKIHAQPQHVERGVPPLQQREVLAQEFG